MRGHWHAAAHTGRTTETVMDQETLNLSIRKFLKTVGVNAQREIEQAVAKAIADKTVSGTEALPARMTLQIAALQLQVQFDGEVRLLAPSRARGMAGRRHSVRWRAGCRRWPSCLWRPCGWPPALAGARRARRRQLQRSLRLAAVAGVSAPRRWPRLTPGAPRRESRRRRAGARRTAAARGRRVGCRRGRFRCVPAASRW